MIIDAHAHLGGPDIGDRKSLKIEKLIAEMKLCGVDKTVAFPFNQPQDGFAPANDYIAKAAQEYPEYIIGFARLNPVDEEKALAELDRIHELELKGVKLHPSGQNFTLDNKYLHKIAERALEYKLPLLFDTGKPQSRPEHLQQFAEQHPDNIIIMAHMRGDFIPALLACPNMYLQTTSMPRTEVIEKAVREIGAERIMMGSDHPYLSMSEEAQKIRRLEITKVEKAELLGKTAGRVLGA